MEWSKRKHSFTVETNSNTFKCHFHLTERVCTTERFFSKHVFLHISYCILKITTKEKNISFLTSVA